jgi:Zn-dependent protease
VVFQPVAKPKIFWFSSIEVKHLLVGIVLVSLVGISFITRSIVFTQPFMLVVESIVFILSFIAHELSHKFVAQKFGLWAEFRLSVSGALITLISILLPLKVIAPGSVVIGGMPDKETVGRTAISGPLVNVILSVAFLVGAIVSRLGVLYDSLMFGAWFNAYLAIFNLLPFGALDGWKVFWWSRRNWALIFSLSIVVGVYSFIRLG